MISLAGEATLSGSLDRKKERLGRGGAALLRLLPTGVFLFLAIGILGVYLQAMRPTIEPGVVRGPKPSSHDYAYGAQALLNGRYVVEWDDRPYVPRYPPGFPFLLMPAVANGGVEAAVLVPYAMAGVLAVLAALVAVRVRGPLAAPAAVFLVLAPTATKAYAGEVMSDLPTAALAMLELALIVVARGPRAWLAAGVVAGFLVLMRVEAAVLLVAGLAASVGTGDWRRRIGWYALGAAPLLVFLGLWQTALYGSPITTGYQVLGKNPSHGFFSPYYVLGPPDNTEPGAMRKARDNLGEVPNLVFYTTQLLGEDNYITATVAGVAERFEAGQYTARLPGSKPTAWGAGALGVLGLVRLALSRGTAGLVGRFGLAMVASLLAVFSLYYYQAPRFMVVPGAFLNLGAAAAIAEVIALAARPLGRWLESAWIRAVRWTGAQECWQSWNPRQLALLLATSGLVISLYGLLTPYAENPDGPGHVSHVVWLADRHRLPSPHEADRPADQSSAGPLYYLLAATAWSAFATGVPVADRDRLERAALLSPNPGYESGLRPNHYLHKEQERFPFEGWARALYLVRIALLPIALAVVAASFALALQVRPGSRAFALFCAASVAFLPQFAFLSGSIQNEVLPALWAGIALSMVIGMLRTGRVARVQCISLGLVLAAGLWTKECVVGLLPAVALGFVLAARRRRELAGAVLWATAGFLALAGPLLIRNLALFGNPLGMLAVPWAMPGPLNAPRPPFPTSFPETAVSLWTSFVANMGWLTLPLGPAARLPYDLFGLLAATGCTVLIVRAARGRLRTFEMRCVVVLLTAVLGTLAWYVYLGLAADSAHGRHLFTALPAMGVLAGLAFDALAHGFRLELGQRRLAASAFLVLSPVYAAIVAVWLLLPTFGSVAIASVTASCDAPEFAEVRLETYQQREAERQRLRALYGEEFDVAGFNEALTRGHPVQKARVFAGVPRC